MVLRWASTAAAGAPKHVAIVGTGPSGFYTAKYLVKDDPTIRVDLFDALPTPKEATPGTTPQHTRIFGWADGWWWWEQQPVGE